MDGNRRNATRVLVQFILSLTNDQRRSTSHRSICQTVHCIFPWSQFGDVLNLSCRVDSRNFLSSINDDRNQFNRSLLILVSHSIRLYLNPLFTFMGIVGNSLSCLIMFLNVRRNGYQANFYLALLALVDCLFLLGSGLTDWISAIDLKLDVRRVSANFGCRFIYLFGNLMTHLSAGLVVSVTVERFIAIRYPLIVHQTNQIRHAHVVFIVFTVCLCLLDSRILFFVETFTEKIHTVQICDNETSASYERRDIYDCVMTKNPNEDVWVFIDFAVYMLIPFLIIITLNSLIIFRLIVAQRSRQLMSHSTRATTIYKNHSTEKIPLENVHVKQLRRTISVPPTTMVRFHQIERRPFRSSLRKTSVSTDLTSEAKSSSPTNNELLSIRSNNNIRLTILLLFISCSYCFLTLPAVVLNLFIAKSMKRPSKSWAYIFEYVFDDKNITKDFYYTIGRLLMIINHSTNFIFYFVVGKRFRRDLKRLFSH